MAAAALASATARGETATAASGTASGASAIAWEDGFRQALRRARNEGRPVMVDFWADWCHFCHELEATTYRAPRVVELAQAFVAVRIDTEGDLASRELAARFGVETLPTIAFVSPAGRLYLRRSSFEGPDLFPSTLAEALRRGAEVAVHEAALERDGKDPEALASLGRLLVEQGLTEDARALLRDARKRDRDRPAAERKRTRRLLAVTEAEDRRTARQLLEEALAITPAQADEDAAAEKALAALGTAGGQ